MTDTSEDHQAAERRERYHEEMRRGQAQYQDVLDELAAAGLPAIFTQTGGMCAALEVQLETGHTLLITDADDTLAWNRGSHQGWGVGLFPPEPESENERAQIRFAETPESSIDALLRLVRSVLSGRV